MTNTFTGIRSNHLKISVPMIGISLPQQGQIFFSNLLGLWSIDWLAFTRFSSMLHRREKRSVEATTLSFRHCSRGQWAAYIARGA